MSHITTVEVDITDHDALADTCRELGLQMTAHSSALIFQTAVDGTVIQLPGWTFPVIVKDKTLVYDNYQGAWGDIGELNKLRRHYAIKATTRTASRMGRKIIKREEHNGRIRLTLA